MVSISQLKQLLSGEPNHLIQWLEKPTLGKIILCLVTITVGCGVYGLSIGVWRSPLMGLYVGIKFPLLIFLTLCCNGILNGILALMLGSGLGLKQSLLALLMSFTVFSLLNLGLAPVTLYFALNFPSPGSEHAQSAHAFYLLIHTSVIAYTGIIANLHLFRYLKAYSRDRRVATYTLIAWLLGNGFVGAQFSWILRPFFGTPKLNVAFLREDAMNGTFYEAVTQAFTTIIRPLHIESGVWVILVGVFACIVIGICFFVLFITKQYKKHYD